MAKAAAVKERETKAEVAKAETRTAEPKTNRAFNDFPRVQMQVYVMNQPENAKSGLRYTGSGKPVFKLRCNVQPGYKERQENAEAEPIWYTLEVWGEAAHTLAQWQELKLLEPGATLLVAGNLEAHNWQSDTGARRDLVLKGDDVALIAKAPKAADE